MGDVSVSIFVVHRYRSNYVFVFLGHDGTAPVSLVYFPVSINHISKMVSQ